jgi:PleD family two-component response regulator
MLLKNKIYYVVIIGKEKDDHFFLRKALNKLVPQAIVESLYGDEETVSFFARQNAVPSIIFLDKPLLSDRQNKFMNLIRYNEEMLKVPVIILSEIESGFTKTDSIKAGADEVFSRSYHVQDVDAIASEIREKWFLTILDRKNIS